MTSTRSHGGSSRSKAPGRWCQAKASPADTGNRLVRSIVADTAGVANPPLATSPFRAPSVASRPLHRARSRVENSLPPPRSR